MTPEIPKPDANTVIRWAWACAMVAMILIASGRSQVASPGIVDFDKAAHFSVFGLLATLVARADRRERRRWRAILVVSLFGASDELHQSFTPGRSVEVADWVADTLGAITAVTVYQCWPAYHRLMERRLFVRREARTTSQSASVTAERRLS